MYIAKLKEMFEKMVIKKDSTLIPHYYHQNFLLYTNDQLMNYDTFLKSHLEYYNTPIQYEVVYDDETLIEQENKVAGRIWITTTRPNEMPKKIEVILIAQFKDNKIYRLWELTYPDWSNLAAFKSS